MKVQPESARTDDGAVPVRDRAAGGFWRFIGATWRFFSSVKLAIVLLILIGLGAIAGTFIPQLPQRPGLTLIHLESSYSPGVFTVLSLLQLFDLFHSWWFSLLLDLLALNLLACSTPRLVALWGQLRRSPSTPEGVSGTRTLRVSGAKVEPEAAGLRRLIGIGVKPPDQEGRWWRAEAGRWSRPGFVLLHVGVVIVLVGGALGQMSGLEGSVALSPGQSTDTVRITGKDGGTSNLRLPFAIRCQDFEILRYASGESAVREFVTQLQVQDGDRVVRQARLVVNRPLSFGGFSFYQSSYQNVRELDRAVLVVRDVQGARKVTAGLGEVIARGLDDTEYRLQGFREQFGHLGEAVRIETTSKSGQHRRFWVFANYPGFAGESLPGRVGIDLDGYRPGYATILGVARDPGTPLLWGGCLLLLLGLISVFVGRHRRVWLRWSEDGLEVVCWSHRNVEAFARSIAEALALGTGGRVKRR